MARLAFAVTLSKTLQLVRTTNGERVPIDGESSILKSDPGQTDETFSTGVAGVVFEHVYGYTMPADLTLAADVFLAVRWRRTSAGGSGSTGRIVIEVRKNGSILGSSAAGETIALDTTDPGSPTIPALEEILLIRVPSTSFSAGDLFQIVVGLEVVAAFAGNSTVRLYHDPAVAGSELMAEVNI